MLSSPAFARSMKVLLFANDLMPFGSLPTSGGGLRCYQLMRGLEAHGVEVVASMPAFTFLAEKHFEAIPEAQWENLWRRGTQDEILRRVKPDAVLFASNWDHFKLTGNPDVPVVIDLHGSRLLETALLGTPIPPDHKVRILSRADCLLSAALRQRSYYTGWLVQAGRVPEEEHFIRYVPVSLAPELPEHVHPAPEEDRTPHLVSGGGWFPWQDQSAAVLAACREVTARDRGRIEIFGTPHESARASREEKAIRDLYRQVQALAGRSPRIRARGYVGRDALVEIYRGASVALEAMRYNLERELAFTTRTIEYLWCGLPVLYNNYGEVSEHIREYDAGWTVDPEDGAAVAAALDEIFSDPAAVRRKSANAQRLVRDRFTWDKTVLPLLDFLRHPRKAPPVEPVVGTPVARPSYLAPRGASVEIPLRLSARFRQPFVVPADRVRSLDLPFRVQDDGHAISEVRLRVETAAGRLRARRTYRRAELAGKESLGRGLSVVPDGPRRGAPDVRGGGPRRVVAWNGRWAGGQRAWPAPGGFPAAAGRGWRGRRGGGPRAPVLPGGQPRRPHTVPSRKGVGDPPKGPVALPPARRRPPLPQGRREPQAAPVGPGDPHHNPARPEPLHWPRTCYSCSVGARAQRGSR